MKIITTDYGITYVPFINDEPMSEFAPSWRFFIAHKLLPEIDCNRLKNYLLSKRSDVLKIKDNLNDGGTGLGNDTTTARYRSYNVLTWDQPDMKMLNEGIADMFKKYYNDIVDEPIPSVAYGGWMNIMKRGERIKRHNHSYSHKCFLSGHFTVACDDTMTVYTNPYEHWNEDELLQRVEEYGSSYNHSLYTSKNVEGQLTLFPNYVPHFTTEHRSDSDRITIAFEIFPNQDFFCPY
tara:strand:+ start:1919 stop:2626 length:708 start_codon:yes stop_codon:yes gene_type:complete